MRRLHSSPQLRRSGKKYDEIAGLMGRTKNSVKSMCERLERAEVKVPSQKSSSSSSSSSSSWNDRMLQINQPLIQSKSPKERRSHSASNKVDHPKDQTSSSSSSRRSTTRSRVSNGHSGITKANSTMSIVTNHNNGSHRVVSEQQQIHENPRDNYRPFGPSMPHFFQQSTISTPTQHPPMLFHPHFNHEPQHPPFPNPADDHNPRDEPLHKSLPGFSSSVPYGSQQSLPSRFPLNSEPPSNSVGPRDCVFTERSSNQSSISSHSQMTWPSGNQTVSPRGNSNPPDHGDTVANPLLQSSINEQKRGGRNPDHDESNKTAATIGRETAPAATDQNSQVGAGNANNDCNTENEKGKDEEKVADGKQNDDLPGGVMQKKENQNNQKNSPKEKGKVSVQQNVDGKTKATVTDADDKEGNKEDDDQKVNDSVQTEQNTELTSIPKENGNSLAKTVSSPSGKQAVEETVDRPPESDKKDIAESGRSTTTTKDSETVSSQSCAVNEQEIPETTRNETAEHEESSPSSQNPKALSNANKSAPLAHEQRKDVDNNVEENKESKKMLDTAHLTTDTANDSDCVIIGFTKPSGGEGASDVASKPETPSLTVLPLPEKPENVPRPQHVVSSRGVIQPKASSLSLVESASKPSPGNQGSAEEYKRLVMKHGQVMIYNAGQLVLYFVPRLAARARFKDRLGTVVRKIDHDLYEIRDQQNNRIETVPWKWILKAPVPATNTRKRSALQRDMTFDTTSAKRLKVSGQQQQVSRVERIPINSLSSREDKIKEFDRRLNSKKNHSKQYAVPIHSSYYDDDDGYNRNRRDLRGRSLGASLRGRSLRHDVYPLRHHHLSHPRGFEGRNLRSPPPPTSRRKLTQEMRPQSAYKEMRSFSVFPQRGSRRVHRSPPLLRDDLSSMIHHPASPPLSTAADTTNSSDAPNRRQLPVPTTDVVNAVASSSNDESVEIKAESTTDSKRVNQEDAPSTMQPIDGGAAPQRALNANTSHSTRPSVMGRPPYPEQQHHRRRPRSRSRSPSHIRPSNRILMKDSADSNVTPVTPRDGRFPETLPEARYFRYGRRYPLPPPSRMDPYYDRYYYRYHDDRYSRPSLPPPDYHRELPPPSRYASPPPPKAPSPPPSKLEVPIEMRASQSVRLGRPHRSRSRSRSRSRERMRDYYGHPHYPPYELMDRERREHYYYLDRREREHHRRFAFYGSERRGNDIYYGGDDRDRSKRAEEAVNSNGGGRLSQSLLMQSWLQVQLRMKGGSKLAEREINYLCQNNISPELIKQYMDADKPAQEKYDLVAQYLDPTKGQNLSRAQVYSIIGAIITMNF